MMDTGEPTAPDRQPEIRVANHNILQLGLHLRWLGLYESALNIFIKIEREAEIVAAMPLLVEALMWKGECFKLLTRYTEAVAAFGRVLSLYARSEFKGDWALQSIYAIKNTLLEIGLAMTPDSPRDRLVYLDSLLTAAEETLWWLRVLGKDQWRSGVLLQMAKILEELERWDEAVSAAREALSVRLETNEGPVYTLGGHLIRLAKILSRIGKSDEALNVINRTLTERKIPLTDVIGAKLTQVHILLSEADLILSACDTAGEAVRLADAAENVVQQVTTRLTFAKALSVSHQWAKVLTTINQAIVLQRGDRTYTGRIMRRHLRNALADIRQSSIAVDAQYQNRLEQYATELGPEEEPWGKRLSDDDSMMDILKWDENTVIPEMLAANTRDPQKVAEIILSFFSSDHALHFNALIWWLVEIFEVPKSDQEKLRSQLEVALSSPVKNIRRALIVEVLAWVAHTRSRNR